MESTANRNSQDFHDYQSDSDDSNTNDLDEDEAEQAALAQWLDDRARSSVHGYPVPARDANLPSILPVPPDVQEEPAILTQLEDARQRLSARPPSSSLSTNHNQVRDAEFVSEGTITPTIRTAIPYRRTVQVTESTTSDDRDAPRDHNTRPQAAPPVGHSTTFLLFVSILVALIASALVRRPLLRQGRNYRAPPKQPVSCPLRGLSSGAKGLLAP